MVKYIHGEKVMPRAKKDLESPIWNYYIVPVEDSVELFHVKRERKISLPIEVHGFVRRQIEDPNIEWCVNYDKNWSHFRTEYMIELLSGMDYRYNMGSKERMSADICEKVIREKILCDIKEYEEEKAAERAKQSYQDRVLTETRKVPPYKVIKS